MLALRAERLTTYPDEVGFLGNAWFLGRGQPAPPMGFAPFYPAGQPALLAPLSALTGDPDTLATGARLVDVALLAALVPVLVVLLGRVARLDLPRRVLAATVAAALPGLWIAAVVAWPDALAALLWPAALLALAALVGRGPWTGRIWFGPSVALLWTVHARFLPVVVLAVAVLVLRVVVPGRAARRAGPGSGGRAPGGPRDLVGDRGIDLANLALAALVLAGGTWLNARVAVRWDGIAPGPLEGAFDDLGATTRGSLRSLAGQSWYALAGTAGLAGVGAVSLARAAVRAARRGRALWTEPVPAVAAMALLGWLGVVLGTAVQLRSASPFGDEPLFDIVANGRYQEVVLAPLVAVGAVRLLHRTGDAVFEPALAVAVVVLGGIVTLLVGSDPGLLSEVGAAGVAWSTRLWPAAPVVLPTVVAVAVLAAARLRPPGRRAGVVLVSIVLAGAVVVGVERSEEVVAESRTPTPVSDALPRLRQRAGGAPVAYLDEPGTLAVLTEVSWGLAVDGMRTFTVGQAPPAGVVVTADDHVAAPVPPHLPPGTRLSAVLRRAGLAVWALPGPEVRRLQAAGLLHPATPSADLPLEARRATIEVPPRPVDVGPGSPPVPVVVGHAGAGSVWPSGLRPGEPPVDLVLTAPDGATVRTPVGELDPGATTTVEVSAATLRGTLGPGRHELDVAVGPLGGPTFAPDEAPVTLAVVVS